MISREACPITQEKDLVVALDMPYHSGVLGEWSRESHHEELLRGCNFTILHNRRIDFYFQRWVFDLQVEIARRKGLAGPLPTWDAEGKPSTLASLSHKAEDAMLIRLLCEKPRPRVLDYGMATGEWALMAKAYGCESWGTDIDPRSPQLAKANGLRFAEEDGLPDQYFDFINADQVFEHLPSPRETLGLLQKKLAPGGFLKISTPGDRRMGQKIQRLKKGLYTLALFRRDFFPLSPLCHTNLFSAKALKALAQTAGLEPYRLSLRQAYAVMTDFHTLRQFNRNLHNPWKRCRSHYQTWQFFRKSPGEEKV
ncbi:MAG: class I SAM-dependent methyltransferase [Chthoniobacteraceae bacterium]|nr:class I SAM-dependent methyltransferase [Chthoniobacteraceae bacterium]